VSNTLFHEETPALVTEWHGDAEFEDTCIGRLRWRLDRWRDSGPRALICMANPSSAGASKDDPTIQSIKRILPPEFVGFTVVNWNPYIATNPDELYEWRAAYGSGSVYQRIVSANESMIRGLSSTAAIRFVAWGNLVPNVPGTQRILLAMSCDLRFPLYAFGLNQDGSPKHPMARGTHRIANGASPVIWRAGA
jgi:hypothetical protein